MKGVLPPSYVNTPVSIAYARVDDALIVTMTRILGFVLGLRLRADAGPHS